MIDTQTLTLTNLSQHLTRKDFSVSELVDSYLARIAEKNKDINAYLEVFADAKEQAIRADERIAAGEHHPLSGAPLAIKDNIVIDGRQATSASKILEGFVAATDATVIKKLKAANTVFLGRTNMDEFAMGGSTENSAFGPTKNPLDTTRVSGGSSGGSAAAVAMGGALASLGSDTGGSVREPAAFCGLVGLKPTYGSVSRSGLMALGSSLDVIGTFTKTVSDAELLFNTIRGQDPLDGTTYGPTTYPREKTTATVIGVPFDILDGLPTSVRENFDKALKHFEHCGYEIRSVSLPNITRSLAAYYILMPAEASSNLARFDGVKYGLHVDGTNLLDDYLTTRGTGFGPEVRRRILIGTYVLSAGYHDAYYNKALLVRHKISEEFTAAFKGVDLIATPTVPMAAFPIGEKANDPLAMYLADIFTIPANIAGIPAVSIPSGTIDDNGSTLPLGMQLMAPHDAEHLLFDAGKRFLSE